MNLIDKYIAEVGKHLPRKNRTDIEAEIRSTLEDMLDERKQADSRPEEELVMELLKEYGAPVEVAAKYKPHPYLIGPRLFPLFESVPEIKRIRSVSSFACPSTWDIETDRGDAQLVLKGEEDIRRLDREKLLIADLHGIQYLVRSLSNLDRGSRKLLDRFL